jgi:zinc/manganese transport system substrate-binding protein
VRRELVGVVAFVLAIAPARAEPVRVVAAESVYGDLCRQIGGEAVRIVSILSSPEQDPHEFDPGAATARDVAQARLVVWNGAGYDDWMTRLVRASPSQSRETIEVAKIANRKAGDNPHLWYDVRATSSTAKAIADALMRVDPAHRTDYEQRLAAFDASLREIAKRLETMRGKHSGAPVAATEPVFDYMADAVGLAMRHRSFQLAVMNGTEPSAKDIAAFERDLRTHAVRALIYNRQTSGALARRMRSIAESSGVAVVDVAESEPPDTTYQQWMLGQLEALDRALSTR